MVVGLTRTGNLDIQLFDGKAVLARHGDGTRAEDKTAAMIPQFITSRSLIIFVPFLVVVVFIITELFFLRIKERLGFENPPFEVGCLQRLFEFFGFSAMHLPWNC